MVDMPEYPDPLKTANAQAGMNRDSVIASALINNYDETTPFGSVKYDQAGTRSYTDAQGNQVTVPYFNRNVTLDPSQQQALNYTNQAKTNLAGMAAGTTGFLRDYLATPFDPNMSYRLDTSQATPESRRWVEYTPDQIKAMTPTPVTSNGGAGAWTPGNFKPMSYDEWTQRGYEDYHKARVGDSSSGASYSFAPTQAQYQKYVDNERAVFDDQQRTAYTNWLMQNEQAGQSGASGGAYSGPSGYWDISPSTAGRMVASEKTGSDRLVDWQNVSGNDFEASRRAVEEAMMSRYNRQFADVESALDQKLRNQGLMPGTEAYDTQFRQMREMQTDAMMQAVVAGGQEQSRLAALEQGRAGFNNNLRAAQLQEALTLRNQPINEALALLSGSQVEVPSFVAPFQAGVQSPDYMSLVDRKYQADSNAAQASAQGLFGLLGMIPGIAQMSEPAAKTDIVRIGSHGRLGVYRYRYLGNDAEQVGFMADEVEAIAPHAITRIGGLRHVNYVEAIDAARH